MHARSGRLVWCGDGVINTTFLDALYGGGKLTAEQRSEILAGRDPLSYGLSQYDLCALTCGRFGSCGACASAAPGSMSRRPGRSAVSSVEVGSESKLLLARNTGRLRFTVKNEGPETLYLAYAATCSLTAYTLDIEPGGFYPDEFGWVGECSACTASGTSTARITELTP